MGKESVDVMIEGGKATAAPPLGPALGPLKVNIGQVVAKINEKTQDFKGMQVPVKVTVDTETKDFKITIGTPPASALIKKEAGVQKGAANPLEEKIADLKIEQIIKISNMKQDDLLGKNNFSRAKEIIGTCDSMGVLVEGKQARKVIEDINNGAFAEQISGGKTELTAEEKKKLEEEKKVMQEELKKKREQFQQDAQKILDKYKNKSSKVVRKAMSEAGIPETIINELAPADK